MAEGKWWFFPFQDFLIGIPWDSTVGAIDVTQGLCRTLAMAWFGESQELCCSWVACSCYNWMGIITAMMINTRMCLYIYMCVKYKHTHTHAHIYVYIYIYVCVCTHHICSNDFSFTPLDHDSSWSQARAVKGLGRDLWSSTRGQLNVA